jgi:hypothetical protein
MRTLVLCLAAATTLLAATPTPAQELRLRGPGVDVDVGARPHRDQRRDRDYYRFRSERSYNRGGCRTVTIHRDNGVTKQIRKCDF